MKDIYTFKFWKHKYGPELLVDIVDYAVETFYSVTIVLDADKFKSLVADNYKSEHRQSIMPKGFSSRRII